MSKREMLGAALALLIPAAAAAQPAQQGEKPAPQSQEKPAGTTFTAGWRDGFFIQNDTGDFRLQIGMMLQADGRFALGDDNETLTDTFTFRRIRPYIRGRIAQRFEFYLNPDFAGGTVVIQDAYIDTRFSNAFRVRVGKAKVPLGHERQHGSSSMLFLDRAFPTAVAPNRDVGIQVLGDVNGGVLAYAGGVFNGTADGGSGDTDANDGKDVAGRIVVKPFAKNAKSPLANLGFALSGSRGKQSGAATLPTIRTSIIQQTFLTYTGAVADGVRTRYSPYGFYYYRGFGGFAEYVKSEVPLREGAVAADIGHEAWQVAASYVLTGENATDTGVRPKNNFNFGGGQWGAFQVAARYHQLTADEAAIRLGLAAAGSSREAKAWTAGLNWYLNPFIKYVLNFERVVFDGDADGPRKAENILAFRTQLNF